MQFLVDALKFILHCRSVVDKAPLQPYSSALLHAPERSVIRERFERHIDWITTKPVVELDWSPRLTNLCNETSVAPVSFSCDGRLASGSINGAINVWDPVTGALQLKLGHDGRVCLVAFSSDGRLLASGSGDGTVEIWDAATGTPQQTLKGCNLAFSSGGRLLASASCGGVMVGDVSNTAAKQ